MTLFPFFQDIEGKRFLIVGGGHTAARKLRVLRQFTDRITVVAERLSPDIAAEAVKEEAVKSKAAKVEAVKEEAVKSKAAKSEPAKAEPAKAEPAIVEPAEPAGMVVCERPFRPADLDRADYVVTATSDRALNREIARLCGLSGKPVDVVDSPELCTFFFPAVIRRGPLVAAVSTSGKSPAYAAHLRAMIEALLPENIEEILDALEDCRRQLPERVPDQRERSRILKEWMMELLTGSSRSTSRTSGNGEES